MRKVAPATRTTTAPEGRSRLQLTMRPATEKANEKIVANTIIPARFFAKKPEVPAGRVSMAMTMTMPTKVWRRTTAMAVTARMTRKTASVLTPRAAGAGEFFVEGAGFDLGVVAPGEEYDDEIQDAEKDEVARGDEEYVTEKVAHGISVPRGFGDEDDADAHADSPEGVDDGVLPLLGLEGNEADEGRRDDGEDEGAGDGGQAWHYSFRGEKEREADAAQDGVGYGAGQPRDALHGDD